VAEQCAERWEICAGSYGSCRESMAQIVKSQMLFDLCSHDSSAVRLLYAADRLLDVVRRREKSGR
jgi:hypothetical protein